MYGIGIKKLFVLGLKRLVLWAFAANAFRYRLDSQVVNSGVCRGRDEDALSQWVW